MGEKNEAFEKINDISNHEFLVLASITGGLILFVIMPAVLLNLIN